MASPQLQKVSDLGSLLEQVPLKPQLWADVGLAAQSLADDLRIRNVKLQDELGQSRLPHTLNDLLKLVTADSLSRDQSGKQVVYETLRVGANLSRDHDVNRGSLLEAGFPQSVVSLLESYAESIKPHETEPAGLSIQDLQIVKTAIGVLLNTSIGYEPVKTRLISLEAATTLLKLSIAIYPLGSWLRENHERIEGSEETTHILESWSLRSSLTSWAWLVISEWEEDEDSQRPRQLFTADSLPYLAHALHNFIPPYPSPPPLFSTPELRRAYVKIDFEVLEEATGELEKLALDVEEAKLALAQGFVSPEGSSNSVLSQLLKFVEHADYLPYWTEDVDARKKGFDRCKAAVIKAVVEVAGDDKNMTVLWDDSQEGKPGGYFVEAMVRWVRDHKDPAVSKRDDLLVCALVNLGNLCRKESHSTALVNEPISILPDLVSLMQPTTDLKVMHGVLGLLKHLATSSTSRAALGQAGVLRRLATSDVIHPRTDITEQLQMSAIGLAKHMCNASLDNSFAVCLPDPSAPDEATLLNRILDLGRRSDSTAIKSESTRVAVNIIKSLWTNDLTSSEDTANVQAKREAARKALVTAKCANALAQLIGRSRKYPMLVNEGVVALTLLSTGENGGAIALDALLNPLPVEVGPHRQPSLPPMSAGGILSDPMSVDSSPIISAPSRAFDMLSTLLRPVPFSFQPTGRSAPTSLPVEVRANICSLLGHLGRKGVVSNRERDVEMLKGDTKDLLENLAKDAGLEGSSNNRSATAAKRALEAWARQ